MAELSRSLTLCREEAPPAPEQKTPGLRLEQLWVAVRLVGAEAERALADSTSTDELRHWAFEITPLVSVVAPDELLLEVQGSLKLFGGLERLKRKIATDLGRRRLTAHACAARTPLAALWLARHAQSDAPEAAELVGRLSVLPLRVTQWPEDVLVLLGEMGLSRIGDCLRLPRDGFSRRVGRHYLDELDRALGRTSDPRRRFEMREKLGSRIDYSLATADRDVLLDSIETLIRALSVDLRRRQSQIRGIDLVFHHRRLESTRTHVEYVGPTHERLRLLGPVGARLEALELSAPVVAVEIEAGELLAMQLDAVGLFPEIEAAIREPGAALVELLRGRFGDDGVYGIALLPEHRPERVWKRLTERQLARGGTGVSPWAHDRPLWILPDPLTLARGGAQLSLTGGLSRESEPERIETGWWDGGDVRRDYYTVATDGGEKLWVYQDCNTHEWYLHGIFG